METIQNFFLSSIEYRHWGFETAITSIVAIGLTIFLQFPALRDQGRLIWLNRSGMGNSLSTFIVFFAWFLVFFIYSQSIGSITNVINCVVLIAPQFRVLIGLVKFNGVRFIDCMVALVAVVLVLLSLTTTRPAIMYVIASIAAFGALWLQPIEIVKAGTSENVSPKFPRNFLIVCVVFAFYGAAIKDWYIALSSAAFGIVYFSTLIVWYMNRPVQVHT
jgi:uncharacterized protein with PQ loop repeat